MMRTYRDFALNFPCWTDWHLGAVLRHHAERTPDRVFLDVIDEPGSWTYSAILGAAERVAQNFLGHGAHPGDRVVIMAGNSSELIRSWFGSALAGLVEVPLNTAYEHEFLAHQLRVSTPRWAVIDDMYAVRFGGGGVAAACPDVEHFWVIDTGHLDEALSVLTALGRSASPWPELDRAVADPRPFPAVRAQDLASIFFTSGTTGPSKGVAMPHAQMYFFAQQDVNLTRLTTDDTYLSLTPLFHGNAQFLAAYPALVAGARFVTRRKFSASRWIDHVRDYDVTVTNFIGVMMDFVWKQPPRPDDGDNHLRCVYAAPTAFSIVEQFQERYGIEAFVEAFGLTETSMPFMTPYGVPRPAGAVGLKVADWFDVRLVHPETDMEVAVGELGELVVRPRHPWTAGMGYYNMPEKTTQAWRNLWFHTGDAMRRDEDGWYYFVDRFKDALRRRGENISSYEVEQAILGHDEVLECAVIGVPAAVDAGEDEVMACVVLAEGADATAKDLWAWCDRTLPKFAVPRFIRFCAELPKSPSQKIQKARLRDKGVTADTLARDS
ncbi:AMP-binding protein [Streptomyces adelaidensis]|uniref:AMP-binding protein n=1 Tax=Streptomyces adelaidensis TaxID=2796465 RepID=UPI001907F4A3|nr:AMP-binding protein [Streptomyces adelaidensis]